MPTYDCRREGKEPGSISFPCAVRIVDPTTGQPFPATVFYLRTAPARIGRFVLDATGEPLVDRSKKQLVAVTDSRVILTETTEKLLIDRRRRSGVMKTTHYERLEIWEDRPWVAVAKDTGQVIAKSEGVA